MKVVMISILSFFVMQSCVTKIIEEDNLPKDIAMKPIEPTVYEQEQTDLSELLKEIMNELESEVCSDPNNWGYIAFGAKPCGGPVQYVAYPKDKADTLLPKIKNYTKKTDEFNKKHQLTSDCQMVIPPFGVSCVDGKPVLNTPAELLNK